MLRAISRPQTVGSLERKRPSWTLRGKSTDLIQLPKLVLGECELDRREIVLKLVEAFRERDIGTGSISAKGRLPQIPRSISWRDVEAWEVGKSNPSRSILVDGLPLNEDN
jgi:hypothetical protein